MHGDRRLDTFDDELVQSPVHPHDRFFPRIRMDNELGDHGIVVRRDDILGIGGRVDADPGSARRIIGR